MRSWWAWVWAGAVVGCAPTVELEVPAAPAFDLPTDAVAVIARDRECQPAADALARALRGHDRLTVDHRAPMRLELVVCGEDQSWTIEEQDSDESSSRRRTSVAARAHAVVAVTAGGRVHAHLIGTGRHHLATSWSDEPGTRPNTSQAVRRQVHEDLADDLVLQLNPVPTLVERRVYPNASSGSARDLHNLAVAAEVQGDLELAWLLAQAAWLERPSPRSASYLDALHRRRATFSPSPAAD